MFIIVIIFVARLRGFHKVFPWPSNFCVSANLRLSGIGVKGVYEHTISVSYVKGLGVISGYSHIEVIFVKRVVASVVNVSPSGQVVKPRAYQQTLFNAYFRTYTM